MLTKLGFPSLFGLLFGLPLLVACAGTETGNPSAQGSLSLRARSGDSQVVTIGTSDGRLRVDSVWVSLDALSLVSCDAQASQVLGATVEDLVGPAAGRTFDRAEDSYCGVSTRYQRASGELPATAPPELPNRSVVVLGRRNDGVSFRLASELSLPLGMSTAAPGFHVDDATHSLILAFDLAAWFASVDLTTATVETDGTIRVDPQRNATLLSSFDGALGASASLHHDLDHDGELDPEELAVIAH